MHTSSRGLGSRSFEAPAHHPLPTSAQAQRDLLLTSLPSPALCPVASPQPNLCLHNPPAPRLPAVSSPLEQGHHLQEEKCVDWTTHFIHSFSPAQPLVPVSKSPCSVYLPSFLGLSGKKKRPSTASIPSSPSWPATEIPKDPLEIELEIQTGNLRDHNREVRSTCSHQTTRGLTGLSESPRDRRQPRVSSPRS